MLENDVNALIGHLKTREGRAIATARAMELGIPIDNEMVREALDYFISVEDDSRVDLLSPNFPEIRARYVNHKSRHQGIDFSRLAGDYINYLYNSKGVYSAEKLLKEAEAAEQRGQPRVPKYRRYEATYAYERGGRPDLALKLARECGFNDRVIQLEERPILDLEKSGRFLACAFTAENLGRSDIAANYHQLSNLLQTV